MGNKKVLNLGNAAACLITVALIVLGLRIHYRIVRRPDSWVKNTAFFKEKNGFDVLFFGSSHMLNAVFPMQLWHDYGIASYNMGEHNEFLPAAYEALQVSLSFFTPSVVVIDCYCVRQDDCKAFVNNVGYAHQLYDAFPLNLTKIKAIMTMNEKPYRAELLFPYSLYHNRWKEFDFARGWNILFNDKISSFEYGSEYRVGVAPIPDDAQLHFVQSESPLPKESAGMGYMKKIIELCREKGIQSVFVYIPPLTNEDMQREDNSARILCNEYAVPYISFLYRSTVDCDVDLFNYDSINSHLNPSGARKVTDCLGKLLQESYHVPDRRNDSNYASWYDDYEAYRTYLFNIMRSQQNLKVSLMLCNNSNYTAELSVKEGVHFDRVEKKLVAQLGSSITVRTIPVSSQEVKHDVSLTIYDSITGSVIAEKHWDWQAGFVFEG